MSKVSIKDHCEITSSKRIFADEYLESGIPFYRGREISEKHRSSSEVSDLIYISQEKYEAIKAKYGVPQKGDILLTSVGTIGNPYLVKDDNKFYFKDGNLTWFRNFKGMNSKWLYYWLLSPQGRSELNKCTIGSSQKAYTISLLYRMQLDLPDLEKQIIIASIISAYDDLIENNEKRIKILEEMAQRLYSEWFVKFKFPGYEKIKMIDSGSEFGKIPEGWIVTNLEDIADIKWGDTSTTKQSYTNDGYDCFSASGLDGKLDHYDYSEDGIVLSAIGANCGVTWLAKGKWSCIKNTIRILKKDPNIDIEYLFLLTSKPKFWKIRGAAQPFISQTEANKYRVIKPTAFQLNKFTFFVRPIFDEIHVIKIRNSNLTNIRDLLIPQLVTGRRVLQ